MSKNNQTFDDLYFEECECGQADLEWDWDWIERYFVSTCTNCDKTFKLTPLTGVKILEEDDNDPEDEPDEY